MAVIEPMNAVLRLRFEAALQDHIARKSASRPVRTQAKKKAEDLRRRADILEKTLAWLRE